MVFLICLFLMVAAPLLHIVLCSLHVTGHLKLPLAAITLTCLIAGIALPVLASYIDIINLPATVRCATPSVGFAFLGLLATITVIPLSAIVFYLISYYKRKKVITPS